MTQPKRRQILIRGLTPERVQARTSAYNELYQGSHAYTFRVSDQVGEWVQLEVPVDLSVNHFHNLAKWFEGDAEDDPAEDVITVSRGPAPWEYWLVPVLESRADWFLTGATGEGKPFQWDCMLQCTADDPRLRRAPMGMAIMFMTRKLHGALHRADADPRTFDQVTLYLEPPAPQSLEMPEPGRLADSFARTPDPNAGKGGFEQVLEWVGSLFSPKKKDD